MGYRCCICGSNEVEREDEVCELCLIGQDPYIANLNMELTNTANDQSISTYGDSGYIPKRGKNRKILLNGGNSEAKFDPYGNDVTSITTDNSAQIYSVGYATQNVMQNLNTTTPAVSQHSNVSQGQPLTSGISKNVTIDNQKKSIVSKWFKSLFWGIPFTADDDITMFQVFPDYTGTSLNAMGNACDQVIVYGKLNNGAICENNQVEVFGKRDANNNIIAKSIRNKASGTTIIPPHNIRTEYVWIITIIIALLLAGIIMMLGIEGIVWALVFIVCFLNLPTILKILGIVFVCLASIFKRK